MFSVIFFRGQTDVDRGQLLGFLITWEESFTQNLSPQKKAPKDLILFIGV
jgi:hypothetical protein